MLEKIRELLSEFKFLSPEDLFHLAGVLRFKQVRKGEHIVREGEFNYNTIRVLKGLLAHYVLDEEGNQKTLLFVPEGKFSGSLQTTINRKPADEHIVALENSLLIVADIREVDRLASGSIRIMRILNESYRQVITEAAERIRFLIVHSHEERYMHFCKKYPDLEQRLKQKDLASYLGITESSLSRIRARLAKR